MALPQGRLVGESVDRSGERLGDLRTGTLALPEVLGRSDAYRPLGGWSRRQGGVPAGRLGDGGLRQWAGGQVAGLLGDRDGMIAEALVIAAEQSGIHGRHNAVCPVAAAHGVEQQ